MDPMNPLSQLDSLNCQYAFFYQCKGGQPVFQANYERFSSASLIKVPILLAWHYLESQGEVSSSELCDLDSEKQVHGAGFSWLLQNRSLPFHDVLLMMISVSDNLATNLVAQRIGIRRLNQVFNDVLGLQDTALERKLMDFEARAAGLDNWVSARDCVRLYTLIEDLQPGPRRSVDTFLANCTDGALLLRDIPRDSVNFRHKTGSIPGVLHDWGYTTVKKANTAGDAQQAPALDKRIFLLTQQVSDEPAAFKVFGQLGRLLAEA
jgi:beta-lactamase class A